MAPTIESAVELWKALEARAGLDVQGYDADLLEELRGRLGLDRRGRSFAAALKHSDITVEQLVDAVLRLARPYAGMTTDVLRMFERAGARRTRDNLRMRFDFGSSTSDLEVDVQNFREWERIWTTATRLAAVTEWDGTAMWELNRILGRGIYSYRDSLPMSPDYCRWLDEYSSHHSFPSWLPTRPTGIGDGERVMAAAWQVFDSFYQVVRRNGRNFDELRAAGAQDLADDSRSPPPQEGPEATSERELAKTVANIESDQWAGTFLKCLAAFAAGGDDPGRAAEALQKLRELQARLPISLKTVEEKVEELFEILSLPIWKKRYELYSVWVGSRIVDALGPDRTTVHAHDDEINFQFSGTHLATSGRAAEEPLYLWAELRSPHSNPRGKGRKANIQPDYTLTHAPITDPRSSILVVECKQYKKASRSNFGDALSDYASGRPNADVILVNYGPANPELTASVPETLRARTHVVGLFRPGEPEALSRFDSLLGRLRRVPAATSAMGPISSIELTWNSTPRDLDLHLIGLTPTEGLRIDYRQNGAFDAFPWVELTADVMTGGGPETLRFAPNFDGAFMCFVHNYSNERPLASSGAKVTAILTAQRIDVSAPTDGDGLWWLVGSYDGKRNGFAVVNRIVEAPPVVP